MSNGYNGWKNYETWVTNLWLRNDQYGYEYWLDRARQIYKHKAKTTQYFSKKEKAVYMFADDLQDGHEQALDDMMESQNLSASLWTDLLRRSLSDVNWKEIAKHIIDEVLESVAECE